MKPGPKARARRQHARDARRAAGKSMTRTRWDRAGWSSLSGAVLGDQPRTRRIPAYEIQKMRSARSDPGMDAAFAAYTGGRGRAARQAGLG